MLEPDVHELIHRAFCLLLRGLEIVVQLWLIRLQSTFALLSFLSLSFLVSSMVSQLAPKQLAVTPVTPSGSARDPFDSDAGEIILDSESVSSITSSVGLLFILFTLC